jgi:Fe-S cluster assembly protein SufD
MTMNAIIWDDYLERLIESWKEEKLPFPSTHYIDQLRKNAFHEVRSLRLPTSRDEEWRFTDISSLRDTVFQRAPVISLSDFDSQKHTFLDEPVHRLVFVDGQYTPKLSSQITDNSIAVCRLSDLTNASCNSQAEQHLGQLASFQDDVFVALNTALMHDGVCVVISANSSVTLPIHVLYVTSGKEVATYPRCLFVAKTGAKVMVVEEYISLKKGASLTNTVTEIYADDSAHVDHIRVQREDSQAFHIANNTAFIEKTAHYAVVSLAFGARISRLDQKIILAGEGAECEIDGLALLEDKQLADTRTFIDHANSHGKSRQLHKCIVDDNAHGVFSGEIMVRPHSQRTDARQLNHNLLLSEKARMDTKPQLEIFADDVKCAHGATVGQLDKDSLFYLQSRGLIEEEARNLLTYAFGGEIIDRIKVPSLRKRLEEYILAKTRIS